MSNAFNARIFPLTLLHTILLFLAITFATVFCTVFFMLKHASEDILNTMSDKIISSKGETIKNTINYYIDTPRQVNSIITHALQKNTREHVDLVKVRSELLNVMETVFADNYYLSSTAFGSVEGDYVGIARELSSQNKEYLTQKSKNTGNNLTFYSGTSEASGIDDVISGYDMFQRPWYGQVYKEKKSLWTSAYRDMNSTSAVSISYSSPTYDLNGKFIGVVSSDLRLTELNNSLEKIKPFDGSILLVVNENNQIVAASDSFLTRGGKHGRLTDQHGFDIPYLKDSSLPVVKKVGQLIDHKLPARVSRISVKDSQYFVLVLPLMDNNHLLNWKSVIIVPEKIMLKELENFKYLGFLGLLGIFSLGLILILVVVSKVISPLRAILNKTDELTSYRWTLPEDKWVFPEIAQLEQSFWKLSRHLARSFEALEKQINLDASTGLLTRAGLISKEETFTQRNLLAVISVDNMNAITNSLGYEYGNEFIRAFIDKMHTTFPQGTLICRDAVDKFIAIFPGMHQHADVEWYQQLITNLFTDKYHPKESLPKKFVFIGYAGAVLSRVTKSTLTEAIMNAGIALEYARKSATCHAMLFTESMHAQEVYNLQLHENLSRGIYNQEFHLVLQPIVDLSTGQCHEGECLIRWHSKEMGIVPPDRFIALAEETGLILPLGNWIIERACLELADLIKRGASKDFKLHINISARQLLSADFAWLLLDAIKSNGLKNQNICIEITETVLLQEIERTRKTLQYLRRHGITVAIDDFGSGFSSLSYLNILPFDAVKIDRTFTAGVLTDQKCESIISSIITLTNGFTVPLIAEGIEDEDSRMKLIDLGCVKAQGYYFKKPAPFSEFVCSKGNIIL